MTGVQGRFQIIAARLRITDHALRRSLASKPSRCPVDERATLVRRLAESLDEEHDADAEDAWAEEVAARIEAGRAGRAETITTGEALTQARARLSARRG